MSNELKELPEEFTFGAFYFEGAKYYDDECGIYVNQLPDGYTIEGGHIMVGGAESDEIRFVNDGDRGW